MTSDEIRAGAKGLLWIVFPLPELGRRTSQPLTDITAKERKIRKVELVGDLLDAFRGIFQRVGHFARQGFVNPFRSASAAGALDRRREITRSFAEPLGIPLHRARYGFGRGEQVDERLADLVPGMPDKLLYLDADILFQRDIRLLYDKDVSHVEYAAARDHYGKYLISPDYINAGVLLLNMKNIRRTGLFMKARKLLQTKKLIFADQSAIIRSTRAKMLLPQKFNDQKFLHKHTVVRHFSRRLFYLPYPHTDNIKQWEVERVHTVFHYHAFDDILKEYLYLKHIYEKRKHI